MSSLRTDKRPATSATSRRLGDSAARRAVLGRAWGSPDGIVTVAAMAFVAVLVTNLISLGLDNLRTSVINANWQFSWSHDVDTVLLAVGVCASVVGARTAGAHRRSWIAAAVILALFFLDEVSALHGEIGKLDKLLYAPILVAVAVCVWRLTEGTSERWLAIAGFATLLFAFAMHVAGVPLLLPIGYSTYVYQVGVGFKEGPTLAGLILLVGALWRRARDTQLSRAS